MCVTHCVTHDDTHEFPLCQAWIDRHTVDMDDVHTFGDWLKTMMKAQGYTKSSLSRETGIDRAHIRRMETGEIGMPEEFTREKLHAAFGTSDADLEKLNILVRKEYPRPDGSKLVLFEAAPAYRAGDAADIGELPAITAMLESLPDDAVQHLRKFLEAVTK